MGVGRLLGVRQKLTRSSVKKSIHSKTNMPEGLTVAQIIKPGLELRQDNYDKRVFNVVIGSLRLAIAISKQSKTMCFIF